MRVNLAQAKAFVFDKHGLASASAIAAVLASANPAFAQSSTADAGRAEAEIVVTAQKRSENIQDVPKAVSVVSQAKLTEAGVTNLQDLSRISPSIQGTSAGPFAPPAIRGISSFALSIGVLTKTGIVLDDIPQPTFSTLANELSDVERVEVLPGPQSTLSGRNAAGGLINIVTKSPTSELSARFFAEQTDDRQTRVNGFVSTPLSPTLGVSISAYYNEWDGPYRNVQSGQYLGGFKQRGVRGKLLWSPSDDFTATVTAFYTKGNFNQVPFISGGPYIVLGPTAGFAFYPGKTLAELHPGATVGAYSREVSLERFSQSQNENKGGTLRLDYDTSVGTVSSISSYSEGDQPRTDYLGGFKGGPFFADQYLTALTNTNVKYTTQELRLASSAPASPLQYLFGAFYSDTKNFQPFNRPVLFPVNWDRSTRSKSLAIYGRSTYKILPETSLTVGLRYQHDDQSYKFVFVGGGGNNSSRGFKYDFVTGEASLQHNFTQDIKGYVTYANAETGKAYDLEDNVSASTPTGLSPINSEKVQSWEGGFKTQWFDRQVTFNISAFRASYKNYQVQSLEELTDPNAVPRIRLLSIGRVVTKGIEASFSYSPTRDLRLGLDATYLDAKITDYPGARCYPGQTVADGCIGGFQNRRGRLPGTSKFRVTSTLNYTQELASLPFDATFGALFRYQSAVGFDVLGDPAAAEGGYGILNLTAGIKDREGVYKFEIFANNVANKQYYSSVTRDVFATGPALLGSLARDSYRYFGGRLTVDF